jgi:EpsD family peptidyl-prolyl cis-trans isomerase
MQWYMCYWCFVSLALLPQQLLPVRGPAQIKQIRVWPWPLRYGAYQDLMELECDMVGRSAMRLSSSRFQLVGRNVFLAALCGLLLAGCGKKEEGEQAGAPKGQVIAHVGKDDVTIQELENEFRWASIPQDKRDDAVVKRILGDLTKRKYFVQKALAAKLDRQPTVLLDLLRSREQILATSFIQRDVASKSTAIGKGDIDKYIAGHPLMFDRRQLLTVDKVSIPLTSNARVAIEATKDLKSLEEIEQKLTEMGMLHNRSMGVISSGDLTEEFLNTLKSQKPDDVFFVPAGSTGTFFKVKGQETRPLTGDDAAKLARQQLLRELLRTETGKQALSAEADVKYEGDYARIMSEQPKADSKDGAKSDPGTKK